MIGSKFLAVALLAALAAAALVRCEEYSEQQGESAGFDLMGSLTGGLTKGTPMEAWGGFLTGGSASGSASGSGSASEKSDGSVVVSTKVQEKTEVKTSGSAGSSGSAGGSKKEEGSFLGVSSHTELIKLMLNPIEFCSRIAKHFKLTLDKFLPLVSKGLNFGLELAVHPLLISFKIIEKVFVPDTCKLKFACKAASTLSFSKAIVPTLSDKVLNESKLLRALSDGIHGQDCESYYPCNGQPKLREEYKDKKGDLFQLGGFGAHEHKNGDSYESHRESESAYAASNLMNWFAKQ